MAVLVFDLEVYADFFLLMCRNIDTGITRHFELYADHPFACSTVMSLLRRHTLVSFNGRRYDMPLLMMACRGESEARIKEASDAIIVGKQEHWSDEFRASFPKAEYGRDEFDHIDLIEVAPGTASLKIYGGRMHSRRMQDLPIEPDASITPEMRADLIEYCGNDLQTTIDLYRHLAPQLDLRVRMGAQYGVDLRSKSDAQISEQVIRGRVQKDTGKWIERPVIEPGTAFRYTAPDFVSFSTPTLRDILARVCEASFTVSATGGIEHPEWLGKTKITIGAGVYRMGIGGLHSSEQSTAHVATDDCLLVDRDVTSYYPSIILRLGLYPEALGPRFLAIYRDLFERRVRAKHAGNKVEADSLKTTVLSSFGKFNSKWSTLYSPSLLVQVTLTGQLCLLMLIELLEAHGIAVVSANTDGVVIKCPEGLEATMERCVWVWEAATGFSTEETRYAALYSADVNDYVALKVGGGTKLKGRFAPAGLAKNPTAEICTEAAVAFLEHGVPVEDTVMGCTDVRKFVSVRKVNGGAVKDGEYLGKAVRWVYAVGETGTIQYRGSGYTVARTEGAKPLMLLPDEVPAWLDRDWYVREARSVLSEVGWKA